MTGLLKALNLGKTVIDKIWMDKDKKAKLALTRSEMYQQFNLAIAKLKNDGELKEWEDEADRRKDIRESGWLSRQVRPIIALTFHFFFWFSFIFDPGFKAKIQTVIAELSGMKITVGAVYVLVVCFYFLTKGIKDYFITKKGPVFDRQLKEN